jgi:hypothetical protein
MRSVAIVAIGALGIAACGGGGGGGGSASCTPGPTATLTINDSGFPGGANNACVQLSGQVTFTNAGMSAHAITFDTNGCPSPVSVPAGSSSSPVTFPNTVVNCTFHIDSNTAESGTVAVTSTTVSGGGY